jgi:hypothetical protein
VGRHGLSGWHLTQRPFDARQHCKIAAKIAAGHPAAAGADDGGDARLSELAAAEKINSSYVSRVLRLTLLAPDIEAILDGRQPERVTLPRLMRPFPVEWDRQ